MYVPKRRRDDGIAGDVDLDRGQLEDLDKDAAEAEFLRQDDNLERLEVAGELYVQKAMKLMHALDNSLVERETLKHVISIERQQLVGCLSLPFTFAFFLIFATSSFLHEDITNVFLIESGLRTKLGAGVEDVADIEDTWTFLNNTLGVVFTQTDYRGNIYEDKSMWNRVLMYNKLQGPLMLEQLRSKRQMCASGSDIGSDTVCYPMDSQDVEPFGLDANPPIGPPQPTEYKAANVTLDHRLSFYESAFSVHNGRRLHIARPEYLGRLPGNEGPSQDAYRAFMYTNTPIHLIQEHFNFLHQKGWLDAQTKSVTIQGVFLNSEIGRTRLEVAQIWISFSRSGGAFVRVSVDTIFLKLWDGMKSMIADLCWTLMLIVITIAEIWHVVKSHRAGRLLSALKTFWSLLQWTIIGFGWMCLVCYVYQNMLRSQVIQKYGLAMDATVADQPADFLGATIGEDLHEAVAAHRTMTRWFRVLIAEYHLILMVRFFTAFNAQPRLGVVISTLELSLIDILHFIVVLLPTFFAYAISGCFIFGRRIEAFSTFDAAIGICFMMAMENEYDWPTLSEEHWTTAALWIWSFMLLICVLMLNMILAIMMDAYAVRREASGKSETVLQSFYQLFQRFINRKRWISNAELVLQVQEMGSTITREELYKNFPGMCDAQANSLLNACRYRTEVETAQMMKVKPTMKMAMATKLIIDKISESINELATGTEGGEALKLNKNKDSWIFDLSSGLARQNHSMLGMQWKLQQLQWQYEAFGALHPPEQEKLDEEQFL